MNNGHHITASESVPVLHTGHSHVQLLTPPELLASEGMSVIRGTLDGPGIVPLHSHAAPESFFVLEGEMEAYQEIAGSSAWARVRPGDFTVIPSNTRHAWRNTGSKPCIVLIVTNEELTAFLEGMCTIERTSSSPQEALGRTLELAARLHCWLATPEENAAIGLKFP